MSEVLVPSDDTLHSLAKDLNKKDARDHAISVVKSALSLTGFGGAFSSLLGDYIPTRQAERLQKFAEAVADEVQRLETKLDASYIETDEFAFLVQKIIQNVGREYQKAKLDAYRNMVVNALRVDIPSAVQEGYLNKVESLTPLHIRMILAVVYIGVVPKSDDEYLNAKSVDFLGHLLPDFPKEMVLPCAHDLDAQGITQDLEGALQVGPGFHAFNMHLSLTNYGRGLLDFIRERE